jgi:hypothetical protein
LDYQTCNADLLEKFVHFILERYRCNSNREFFDCELDYIKKVVLTSGKVMDTLKSCYHQISDDEFAERLKQHAVEVYGNASNGDTLDHEQSAEIDFCNWCTQNIQESKNSVLKLANVICAFTCTTSKMHSKESSKYKTQLELFIEENYPMIRHEHGVVTIGDIQYRGWKGLSIKPVNNKFSEWLDNNVECCTNSVLQLSDICEAFLGKKVGPRIMTDYKSQLEDYIRDNYTDIDFQYQKGTTRDGYYRGWLHLRLSNKPYHPR